MTDGGFIRRNELRKLNRSSDMKPGVNGAVNRVVNRSGKVVRV